MRLHPEEFHIQMAATACVYNLTKGDIGQKIHPHILKEVVHCTLAAMENFPNHLQVKTFFNQKKYFKHPLICVVAEKYFVNPVQR